MIKKSSNTLRRLSARGILLSVIFLITVFVIFQTHGNALSFNAIELSKLQKEQMRYLGFDEAEMRQFLIKRDVYRGYIDIDKLSPHEVLGIFSTDLNQQREYAREAAKLRLALINDTKRFEDLYRAEVSRLSNGR